MRRRGVIRTTLSCLVLGVVIGWLPGPIYASSPPSIIDTGLTSPKKTWPPQTYIEVRPGDGITALYDITASGTRITVRMKTAILDNNGREIATADTFLVIMEDTPQHTGWVGTDIMIPDTAPLGTYDVRFSVWSEDGTQEYDSTIRSGCLKLTLEEENDPPTCSLSADLTSGTVPLSVTFNMSASDSDGSISSWTLDVDGDGIIDYSDSGNPPSMQEHTYTDPGEYTANLTVTDNEGSTASSTETINVRSLSLPAIASSHTSLNFTATEGGTNPDSQILEIWNSGDGDLNWSVDCSADWLILNPISGVSTGERANVAVSVDIAGMSAGEYSTAINISALEATNSPQVVSISLIVYGTQTGTITVTSTPSGASFTLTGPVNYTSITPWYEVDAQVGTYVITWKSMADYSTPASETKNLSLGIAISFDGSYVAKPTIASSPSKLLFTAVRDSGNQESQTLSIWNSGVGDLRWSVSSAVDWLDLGPNSGKSTGETDEIAISVDITGMDVGEYIGTITISDPKASNPIRTVPVSLIIRSLSPTIAARIDSYSPSKPVDVDVGNSTTISVSFSNTGNTAWRFIVGVTVWDSSGKQVANYSMMLSTPLQPQQRTTVDWIHTVNQAGDYWLQFGIWQAKPYTNENLLHKKPSPSQRLIIGGSSQDSARDNLIQLIRHEAISAKTTTITVNGEEYFILTLRSYIDPNTLETQPIFYVDKEGNLVKRQHKVYVDAENCPVSNKEIVSKIGFIDFAREKAQTLQQDIDELVKIQAHFKASFWNDFVWSVVGSTNTLVSDIKSVKKMSDALENIESIKDIARLKAAPTDVIVEGITLLIRKTIWDPIGELKDYAQEQLFEAWDSYNGALRVLAHNQNNITSYSVAREFLANYLYGEAHAYVALSLCDKIFNNLSQVDSLVKECFWTVAGWLSADLSDFIELVWEAKQVVDWTWDAADQWNTASSNALNQLWAHKLHEAAAYTLELANSARITLEVHSPVEIRTFNSKGQVTGILNGEEKCGIPYSVYYGDAVTIFFPDDSYRLEVSGIGDGVYDLFVDRVMGETVNRFTVTDVSVSASTTHLLTFDWDSLSKDKNKLPMNVDSDGDGTFEEEKTIYLLAEKEDEGFRWIWIVVGVAIALIIGFILGRYTMQKRVPES